MASLAKAVPQEHDVFRDRFPASRQLSERARAVLAGGATHDSWQLEPHPIFMERAQGAMKWDVDDSRFVDYWMGHGSLILGHGFSPVVDAVRDQARRACHLGATHALQVEWAEQVCQLVPSVERVRFTSSGTEATLLAMRVARSFTGRPTIVRFDGHFHGWHDELLAHFVDPTTAGLNPEAGTNVCVARPSEVDDVVALLEPGDVAAVILEPGGGASGGLPWSPAFLFTLRELTRAAGALLIYDEVISGFRYSPGGVQQLCGVFPDLTVLGKILAGGLPGGAVGGSAEVMTVFGTGTERHGRRAAVPHAGTFNGNPLAAAAGSTTLEHVADGRVQRRAEEATAALVGGVNEAAIVAGVDVRLFATSSTFHLMIGAIERGLPIAPSPSVIGLHATNPHLYASLRQALLLEGVDTHPVHGWVSAAHDAEAIGITVETFARAFERVRDIPGFGVSS